MLIRLLESHDVVIFLTERSELLFARVAVQAICGRLDLRDTSERVWRSVREIGDKFGIWEAD